MALYGGMEAAYETYHFFTDAPDIKPGPDAAQQWDEWDEVGVRLGCGPFVSHIPVSVARLLALS